LTQCRHCKGLVTGKPENGAFQLYTVGFENLTSPIPTSLSYEKAVVLPLATSTAAAGLYMKDFLHLPYPTKNPKATNKSLLVNGASSSVGSLAVQLAVASGLTIVATASAHNFAFVKGLGATEVYDYKDKSIVDNLVSALKKHGEYAGAYDAIGTPDAIKLSAAVTEKLGGGFIASTLEPPKDLPSGVRSAWCMFIHAILSTPHPTNQFSKVSHQVLYLRSQKLDTPCGEITSLLPLLMVA
jgi:NADPH:quinone reductase-like Zn-dependent oxidoreductase